MPAPLSPPSNSADRRRPRGRVLRAARAFAVLLAAILICSGPGRAQQSPATVAPRSVSSNEAGTILGQDVLDSTGENVGPLVDVMVDKNGVPIAGVVKVGGFLGVGTRRIAIAWNLLRFEHNVDETIIHMNLTFDSAAAAPEYQGPGDTLIIIDRAPP